MQSNRKWKIFGIIFIFLCLICLVIGGIGYFYLSNQPPSTLTNDSGYYIRGSKVYYLGGFPSTAFEIYGADVNTFEILDEPQVYALDSNNVYFHGVLIPDADPATFELLDSPYSRDANHVYVSDSIHSNDPAHFEIVQGNVMRDSEHIYWSGEIISDNPEHLVIIGTWGFYTYLEDSDKVYINGEVIKYASPIGFGVLKDEYSRGETNVYYFDEMISMADAGTFEIIESPYSRTANFAFWKQNVILGADPKTFRVLNADFECSADSQTAFYQDQIIPNFDPNTIPTTSQVTNCDANGIYFSP
jgi:hypothetical protein